MMTHNASPVGRRALRLAAALLATILGGAGVAHAQPTASDNDAGARRVLKAMSDYLGSQPNLSSRYDVELDITTPAVEKLTFSASGEMALSRPNKIRLIRTGGYSDVEFVFDGQTATLLDRADKAYTQVKAPGTVDQLIDTLRTKYMIEMPGADLLLSNSYDQLMAGVIEAKHVGRGVVEGVECEHLAFRNVDTDWQLWVQVGDRPLPCKYVITSKTLAAAPVYSVTLRDWKTAAPSGGFTFAPPSGAKAVAFDALRGIGELPDPGPAPAEARGSSPP